jgi:hypothetical protein
MPTALWIPTKPAMHSQSEAGHLFRSEAGRGSDLMSATCGAPLRVDGMMFSFGCRVKR